MTPNGDISLENNWKITREVRDIVLGHERDIKSLKRSDERIEAKLDTLIKWALGAVVAFATGTIAGIVNLVILLAGG